MLRGLGYREDDLDDRDELFSSAVPIGPHVDLSREVDLESFDLPVLNQGSVGSCVLNAGFRALQLRHQALYGRPCPLGDRMRMYYLLRALHNWQDQDSGCRIRDFFKMVNKLGFPDEDNYDETSLFQPPDELWYHRGIHRRLKVEEYPIRFRRVVAIGQARVDLIRELTSHGVPVVGGLQISSEFQAYGSGTKVFDIPAPDELIGGHAVCFTLVPSDRARAYTSWGPFAHDSGFHNISLPYLGSKLLHDIWAVEYVPDFT